MRQIIFSPLAILQDPKVVKYDAGADKWSLDEDFVNRLFCDVANAGAQEIRTIPWGPWSPHPHGLSSQFQPYKMNADRTKFDISYVDSNRKIHGNYNDYYFPIVRRLIEIAAKYDLKTWFCLADNCQFIGDKFDKWSPWANNIQGIGSFYEPKAFPIFKDWFEKCIDEFAGLDVRWPWGNETGKKQMIDLAREAIIPVIKERKLDLSKMTYGATMEEVKYYPKPDDWKPTPEHPKWDYYPGMAGTLDWLKKLVGDTFGDKAKLSIWKEVHGIGGKGYPKIPNRLDQALYWWARPKAKRNNLGVIKTKIVSFVKKLLATIGLAKIPLIRIWLSNDGVFDGDSQCDVVVDDGIVKRRPSAERMATIIKETLRYDNDFIYEHLPKTWDIKCISATLRAMFRALFGREPEEKYHYDPQTPEPMPQPQPQPVKDCRCSYWLTESRQPDFRRWIACLFGGKKRCK